MTDPGERGRTWTVSALVAALVAAVSVIGACSTSARVDDGAAANTGTENVPAIPPVRIRTLDRRTTEGEPIRGWVATIELKDPRVEVLVTEPLKESVKDVPTAEGTLETVESWAKRVRADVAVNANFFSNLRSGHGFKAGDPTDIIGLCVSDGHVVSPAREFKDRGDPALVFDKQGRATICRQKAELGPDVHDAVAGIGPTEDEPTKGEQLVTAGKNTAGSARVQPEKRHPRTAAGVSKDGWTLYLVVIDGRQPEWSVGMTLPELGDYLIETGAHDAINLDGGGSTTMVLRKSDEQYEVLNRVSDRSGARAVGNAVGFRVHQSSFRPQASLIEKAIR